MKLITRIAIAVAILLSGIALVPFAASAQSGTFAWQRYVNGYECTENCLIVSDINLVATPQGDDYLVQGFVTIIDENGNPVQNAAVSAHWTIAGWTTIGQRENTGGDGVAVFDVVSRGGITYTLTVKNVHLEGWDFDMDNSMLSSTITVP